ncbi:hypothetical protein P170DRAFT_168751 [Aspergillus steynii IBT 23096]|uniref:Uncharacterized protein n=1 Tax=Aspergillus steynii IBT 23096 TaxID=1392250 RepID=A0A2I2G7L7_9EURO|nr:uncharacterized protein P170DRAFT_168751 [Aspergillus steynii IBT 23096]PLB48865.1 hypothetical protein P170DRAFT_168751 [Aspergillus steynii IBT 23096]
MLPGRIQHDTDFVRFSRLHICQVAYSLETIRRKFLVKYSVASKSNCPSSIRQSDAALVEDVFIIYTRKRTGLRLWTGPRLDFHDHRAPRDAPFDHVVCSVLGRSDVIDKRGCGRMIRCEGGLRVFLEHTWHRPASSVPGRIHGPGLDAVTGMSGTSATVGGK